MARNQSAKQINFIPADDVADQLAECDNKTKVINEALRMYFSTYPQQPDLAQRVEQLEDFQRRFMAYYARKDNQPHTEFCDCEMCKNNRRSFAPAVALNPPGETFEKVLAVIERAIEQARRMNATVIFETNDYNFRVTANSNAQQEYARYMEFANARSGNSLSAKVSTDPWLKDNH